MSDETVREKTPLPFDASRSRRPPASWHRWMARRCLTAQAWQARQAGDEAEYQRLIADAAEAPTQSLSTGPAVAIADRRL